jgi:hypothetical protein
MLVVEIFKTFWDLLQSEDVEWDNVLKLPALDRFSYAHHATICYRPTWHWSVSN